MMHLWEIQGTENEDKTYQAQAIKPLPAVEMDVNASSKRGSPETQVEPRGKAGRPKVKYTETRPNAEKREGDEPESEVPRKKSRTKGKRRPNLSLGVARGNDDEADDEPPERRRGVRKTIQKPVSPSNDRNTKVKRGICKCKQQEYHK